MSETRIPRNAVVDLVNETFGTSVRGRLLSANHWNLYGATVPAGHYAVWTIEREDGTRYRSEGYLVPVVTIATR